MDFRKFDKGEGQKPGVAILVKILTLAIFIPFQNEKLQLTDEILRDDFCRSPMLYLRQI